MRKLIALVCMSVFTLFLAGCARPPQSALTGKIIYTVFAFDETTLDSKGKNIFVLDLDSSKVVQLTQGLDNNLSPAWSPDGKQIAFVSTRDNHNYAEGIYVMNADGSNIRRLSSPDADGDRNPSWSPDGQRIAYYSGGSTGGREMRIMDLNGIDLQRLPLRKPMGPCGDSSWSPDGNYLVFDCNDISVSSSSGIYKIKTDGTGLECLSCNATSYDDYGPVWSPDGLSIAFARVTEAGFVPYIMNADGTTQRPLLGNNSQVRGRFLAWSPDKEWVFIANNRGGPPYLVKVDGTQSFKIKQISENEMAIVTDWVP